MDSERWHKVKNLLDDVLQREPLERAAFLKEVCNGDDALRTEVETFLNLHDDSSDFMGRPAVAQLAETIVGSKEKLKIGRQINHYEIINLIGTGGMGEVYLAQDVKLHRRVALKLLSSNSSSENESNQRLLREARAAATLEHPNICGIYEVGEDSGRAFIVMQYIEGEMLADKLKREELQLKDILAITTQIADALSEAHAKGIVHRDIKPSNIVITSRKQVKVLDFGLAKKVTVGSEDETQTLLSKQGIIMGTAAYMSPEQARGKTVDARTDVWSLGVVLYEMLAGRNPFADDTTSDTIASILKTELPPLSDSIPDTIKRIVEKALKKNREERYQSAKDFLSDLQKLKNDLEIESLELSVSSAIESANKTQSTGELAAIETGKVAKVHLRRKKILIAASAFGVIALIVFAVWLIRGRQDSFNAITIGRITQLTIWSGLDDFPAMSPDGKFVAYCSDHEGSFEIYVKALTPGAKEVRLTNDKGQNFQPTWSPDGGRIAYYSRARGGIWVIPASGGEAKQLTEFGSYPAWSPDGKQIVFQSNGISDLGAYARNALPPSTLWLVSPEGGEPQQLTQVGNPKGGHGSPAWSPDGKRIAFAVNDFNTSFVWSVSLKGNDAMRVSGELGYAPTYAPDGQSIFYYADGLFQIHTNPNTDEPIGKPVRVTGVTDAISSIRRISFSADGKKAAYNVLRRDESISSLSLRANSAVGPPVSIINYATGRINFPAFSPDGKHISFSLCSAGGTGCDIWISNPDGSNQTQLTIAESNEMFSSWFPDNEQLAYTSTRTEYRTYWAINLNTKRERMLFDFKEGLDYVRLSPDGKRIVFNATRDGVINIWTASLAGGESKQITFDKELMGFPTWSPDGKFIAFQMKRGDDTHIMIMPIEGGTPEQLTFDKGQSWIFGWSADGDKILFAGQRNDSWNVWWYSHSTKKQQQLTDYKTLNSFVRYPAWSPDGKQILYEYSETSGNIWVADLK